MNSPEYASLIAGLDRLAEAIRREAARRRRREALMRRTYAILRALAAPVRTARPNPLRPRVAGG